MPPLLLTRCGSLPASGWGRVKGLNRDERSSVLAKVAGIAGILVAIALTVVIWFQVIDRQATAMLLFEEPPTSEASLDWPGTYDAIGELAAPRPMP